MLPDNRFSITRIILKLINSRWTINNEKLLINVCGLWICKKLKKNCRYYEIVFCIFGYMDTWKSSSSCIWMYTHRQLQVHILCKFGEGGWFWWDIPGKIYIGAQPCASVTPGLVWASALRCFHGSGTTPKHTHFPIQHSFGITCGVWQVFTYIEKILQRESTLALKPKKSKTTHLSINLRKFI